MSIAAGPVSGTSRQRRGGVHPGPPVVAPLLVAFAAWSAGALVVPVAFGAGAMPSPTSAPIQVQDFVVGSSAALTVTAGLFVLAGTMLVAAAAIAQSRTDFLAPHAPGPQLTGVGGVVAGTALMIDGALVWSMTLDAVTADPTVVTVAHAAQFVLGGAVHLMALGVMVLGSAVTMLFVARTPRWLSIIGIVLAVADLLTFLTVPLDRLTPVLPVLRLATWVWLVALYCLVPRDRSARGRVLGRGHRPPEREGSS